MSLFDDFHMIKSFGPFDDNFQNHLPPYPLVSWVPAQSQGSREARDKGKDKPAGKTSVQNVFSNLFSIILLTYIYFRENMINT